MKRAVVLGLPIVLLACAHGAEPTAAPEAEATAMPVAARHTADGEPIVGTLVMRHRSIALTTAAVDAEENDSLDEATAQRPDVMADIDENTAPIPTIESIHGVQADVDL
jgi:hypothetical protein